MNENIKKLIEENPDLALLLSEKDHQINSLIKQVDTLQFTLSKFNRELFGKKSEQMKRTKMLTCSILMNQKNIKT